MIELNKPLKFFMYRDRYTNKETEMRERSLPRFLLLLPIPSLVAIVKRVLDCSITPLGELRPIACLGAFQSASVTFVSSVV
ncbi:hypothetical protein [Leptolyngbya sp. ST-U4]|uniref:hypothetical protein n=1 Tax=Leptolyngbya sp. ST-U4 TaxID=2933912 RepID=UPI00198C8757|nr:hypothetical protein [Leptolyngbya sp. FACHB-711]